MTVKSESEVVQECLIPATPWTATYQALCPWDVPGNSTGVGCHRLLRLVTIETVILPHSRITELPVPWKI